MRIPIEISARHIHLSKEDLERLFGAGYKLKKRNMLSQPGNFAAKETVDVCLNGNKIVDVRVLGPERENTQIEISFSDTYDLGIKAPIRASGNLKGTPGITVIGPKGKIKLKQGVIVPLRHIHLTPNDARLLKVKKNDLVCIKIGGRRAVTFCNVLVRVQENYKLSMHVDTDEANAAGIGPRALGKLLR